MPRRTPIPRYAVAALLSAALLAGGLDGSLSSVSRNHSPLSSPLGPTGSIDIPLFFEAFAHDTGGAAFFARGRGYALTYEPRRGARAGGPVRCVRRFGCPAPGSRFYVGGTHG